MTDAFKKGKRYDILCPAVNDKLAIKVVQKFLITLCKYYTHVSNSFDVKAI